MTIIILGKANTISKQLAQLQSDLRDIVPSGKPIQPSWDSRRSDYHDYLSTGEGTE